MNQSLSSLNEACNEHCFCRNVRLSRYFAQMYTRSKIRECCQMNFWRIQKITIFEFFRNFMKLMFI